MSVTYQSQAQAIQASPVSGGISVSYNLPSGNDMCLFAGVLNARTNGTNTGFTATWNGTSMTRIYDAGQATGMWMSVFYLPTTTSGTNTVTFTGAAIGYHVCKVAGFWGVDPSTSTSGGNSTLLNNTSHPLNVTSTAGGMVADFIGHGGGAYTMTPSRTAIGTKASSAGGSSEIHGSYVAGDGTSQSINWTISTSSLNWHYGVNLIASPEESAPTIIYY